jgi:hypothetical protein
MSPPGFAGAMTGAVVVGAAGGGSSVQPATAIARARLESIDKAWIADLTFTGALLESCGTKQTISIFKSQLTHASGPHVAKTIRETTLPHPARVRIIVETYCSPQRIVGFWNPIGSVPRHYSFPSEDLFRYAIGDDRISRCLCKLKSRSVFNGSMLMR